MTIFLNYFFNNILAKYDMEIAPFKKNFSGEHAPEPP